MVRREKKTQGNTKLTRDNWRECVGRVVAGLNAVLSDDYSESGRVPLRIEEKARTIRIFARNVDEDVEEENQICRIRWLPSVAMGVPDCAADLYASGGPHEDAATREGVNVEVDEYSQATYTDSTSTVSTESFSHDLKRKLLEALMPHAGIGKDRRGHWFSRKGARLT